MPKKIFFAYQGRTKDCSSDNVDAICNAITKYNQYQKEYKAESWEEYKKTTAINVDVLKAINDSSVFVCDLTHFNHNVLFELGYAVGKDRQILVLLNTNIQNSVKDYNEFLLKNIRYTPLTNAQDISTALQKKNYQNGLLKLLVNIESIKRESNDLLYIKSKVKSQPSLDLDETIELLREEQKFSVIDDDTSEVSYRPMIWYFQNILKSKYLIIHLLGENIENAFFDNAKNSFLAGLASGLGRKVFLVAPSKYKAPLDYNEILAQYKSSDDLINAVIEWIKKEIKIKKVKVEKDSKPEDVHELNLIKLGIGCEVAEQEKEGLQEYFIETASYYAAIKQEKAILVGRKGAGKSAIYIRVLKELLDDNLNYIVNLKPEPEELLEDVELSNIYNSPASKKSFFTSVWKLVIFSKLIYFIYEKISNRPIHIINTEEENDILKFVKDNEPLIKMNVFNVVAEINRRLNVSTGIQSPQVLSDLYSNYLNPLIQNVKAYFKSTNTKYYKIIIIADNLDQTWDSRNNLSIQSELIITLIEIENKIKNELIDLKGSNVDVKKIIFLRKDIFDYIIKQVNEPDKFTILSHEINWEKYPTLLKQVIDNRFKYILDLKNSEEVENAWKEFFDFKRKEHPFSIIKDIITIRPRDAIYFVSRLFESAVNKGNKKVVADDLNYAIESYTKFINKNLIAEIKAEFPEIEEILTKLQEYHGKKFEYNTLLKILDDVKYTLEQKDALVKTLFEKEYMLGFDDKTNQPFSDLGMLRKKLKEKKYLFFSNKVYVIAHAKYYYIKNSGLPSF